MATSVVSFVLEHNGLLRQDPFFRLVIPVYGVQKFHISGFSMVLSIACGKGDIGVFKPAEEFFCREH